MDNLVQRVVKGGDRQSQADRFTGGKNLPLLTLRRDITGKDLPIIMQGLHGGELQYVRSSTDLVTCISQAESRLAHD